MLISNLPPIQRLPTNAELLAMLKASAIERPIHPALSLASDHFPRIDLDAAAQHVVEGRCRHVPRRVFEPNSFAMKKGRK